MTHLQESRMEGGWHEDGVGPAEGAGMGACVRLHAHVSVWWEERGGGGINAAPFTNYNHSWTRMQVQPPHAATASGTYLQTWAETTACLHQPPLTCRGVRSRRLASRHPGSGPQRCLGYWPAQVQQAHARLSLWRPPGWRWTPQARPMC